MAKLRHFAIVVSDLERSAAFYEQAFGLERVGRDDLEIGSGIYLSDGTVDLALLKFKGKEGSGMEDAAAFTGAHHFGFIVDDLAEAERKVKEAGGTFFLDLGKGPEEKNFERKYKDPDGIIFDLSRHGWLGSSR